MCKEHTNHEQKMDLILRRALNSFPPTSLNPMDLIDSTPQSQPPSPTLSADMLPRTPSPRLEISRTYVRIGTPPKPEPERMYASDPPSPMSTASLTGSEYVPMKKVELSPEKRKNVVRKLGQFFKPYWPLVEVPVSSKLKTKSTVV